MALNKTTLSVPFTQGLETKTDDLQENLEGLDVLENVIFDTPKQLRKRAGYTLLNTNNLQNQQITNGKHLAEFDDELGMFTTDDYYGYSKSLDRWTSKGNVFTVFPDSKPILRNNIEQKNIDTLSLENINIFTYQDSQGVKVSIVDNCNCNFLLSNELVTATGTKARVANIENTVYIFYIDGTDLKYKTINLIDPTTLSAESIFIDTIDDTVNNFDIVTIQTKIFAAFNSSDGGGTLQVANIDASQNVSSIVSFAGENASNSVTIESDTSSRVVVSYATSTEVKIVILPFLLASNIVPPTTIETISDAINVTTVETDMISGQYTTFYEISNANIKNHMIKKNTITLSAVTGTASVFKRSVGIASKAFLFNKKPYIISLHESQLQSTYFVLDESANIISKISPNVAGELHTENVITKVVNQQDNKFLFGSQIKGRLTQDEDQFFSLLGVNQTVIDFDLDDPFQNATLGRNMHIAGGSPLMYDGESITEHGFHIFPEDLLSAGTADSGGELVNGNYQYSAIYSWTDNQGQLHRSAPSIGLPIILSGGTPTQTQSITVPTLRLTAKENVIIELYRTESNGTIFYKVSETTNPTFNDTSIDSITILDTLSDADLIDNEVLYTTGGVLDNIAAPSASIIESFSDRIFLAGLEDDNKLQFSKIRFENEPIEFNDILTIQVNAKGDKITALKAMDEKLIIFKEQAIFYLSGDGPNNIGQQDTFIKPELVSSDIGCINVNSVVLTPNGLMFQSSKGIYLLTRNLQVTYIGAPVEEFNDLSITSAVVVPEENQVRFTSINGSALVYNYYTATWATFTNHRALHAINIDFTYYYLRFDGILYQEDENSFTDNGSSVNIKLESGWISFAGVQGFQRIYKLLLLGEFKSPHKLRIRIAYDFNEAFTQEVIINTADFTDNTRYGNYSPYGNPSTTPYGGAGNVHQMRVDLARQKCQSIKIRIEEIQSDFDNLGEGLSISNIMFEIGSKGTVNKISTDRQYGTK